MERESNPAQLLPVSSEHVRFPPPPTFPLLSQSSCIQTKFRECHHPTGQKPPKNSFQYISIQLSLLFPPPQPAPIPCKLSPFPSTTTTNLLSLLLSLSLSHTHLSSYSVSGWVYGAFVIGVFVSPIFHNN